MTIYLVYPISFLLLGTLISRLNPQSKDSKGRNAYQVFANSGVSIILCLLYLMTKDHTFSILFVATYAGALSDTFSSEIGRRYGGQPYDILSWKKITTGLSGGVSTIGTAGGVLGSFLITGIYYLQFGINDILFIFSVGFLTMIIDSMLGSSMQAKYSDGETVTENGHPKSLIHGHHIIDNNAVNFLSILLSSLIGYWLMNM